MSICDPEVKVEFEKIASLDVENSTDINIQNSESFLEYAKRNPEYAAFVFTVVSTALYFLLRAIAFVFYLGQSLYFHFDFRCIDVDSDSIIFATAAILIIMIVCGIIYEKLNQITSRHSKSSKIIGFILVTVVLFFGIRKATSDIGILKQIFLSFACSFVLLLITLIPTMIMRLILDKIQSKVESKLKKMKYPTNVGVLLLGMAIGLFVLSFFIGLNVALDQKKFKILDNEYVVIYLNKDIAICSPYTEENNCITINKSKQKNLSMSDIEFETKVFDKVK